MPKSSVTIEKQIIKKNSCSSYHENKRPSARYSILSLPSEVLLLIIKHSTRKDFKTIRLVCQNFFEAYKLIPTIPFSKILQRVYHGDLNAVFEPHFTDEEDQIQSLEDIFRSKPYGKFASCPDHDPILCGRYAILLLIKRDLSLFTRPSINLSACVKEIRDYISNKKKCKSVTLRHASNDIFDMIFPPPGEDAFSGYFSVVVSCGSLQTIRACFEDGRKKSQLAAVFRTTSDKISKNWPIFDLIFLGQENEKSVFRIKIRNHYQKIWSFSNEPDLSCLLLDALHNRDIPFDDWISVSVLFKLLCNSSYAVETLLPHLDLEDKSIGNFVVECGVQTGIPDLAMRILSNPRINLMDHTTEISNYVEGFDDTILFRKLVKNPTTKIICETDWGLSFAINFRLNDCVNIIVENGSSNIDPSRHDYSLFKTAINNNNLSVLQFFLEDPRVDLNDIELLKYVAAFVSLASLNALIHANPSVDLTSGNNELVKSAAEYYNFEVLEFLLKQPGVDPSDNENEALIRFLTKWSTAMFIKSDAKLIKTLRLLLNDPRVDLSARNNEPIKLAAQGVNKHVLQVLLDHPSVDPSADDNEALQLCVQQHPSKLNVQIVKTLLQDERDNPSARNNAALKYLFRKIKPNGIIERDLILTGVALRNQSPFAEVKSEILVINTLLNELCVRQELFRSQCEWSLRNPTEKFAIDL